MTLDEINLAKNEICRTASFCGTKDSKTKCELSCPVFRLYGETMWLKVQNMSTQEIDERLSQMTIEDVIGEEQ